MKSNIESELGRKITEEELNSIDDLNSIDSSVVEEIKLLDHRAYQLYYLKLITTQDNHGYLHLFLDEVINSNEAVSSWARGIILASEFSNLELFTSPLSDLFKNVDYQFRLKPSFTAWKQNSPWVGIPVLVDENATYKSVFSSNWNTIVYDANKLENIADYNPIVVGRRFLAQFFARCLDFYGVLNDIAAYTKLEEISPIENWSEDAKKALDGLIKEKQNYN